MSAVTYNNDKTPKVRHTFGGYICFDKPWVAFVKMIQVLVWTIVLHISPWQNISTKVLPSWLDEIRRSLACATLRSDQGVQF